MDPNSMPDRKCKCIEKSHEKCPVVTGTDQCTIRLGNIIRQSIEKVASLFTYFISSIQYVQKKTYLGSQMRLNSCVHGPVQLKSNFDLIIR